MCVGEAGGGGALPPLFLLHAPSSFFSPLSHPGRKGFGEFNQLLTALSKEEVNLG